MASAYQSERKEMTKTLDEINSADLSCQTATSSTTLQDLPLEILDGILMKAVIKRVMDKKLAKSAWIDCVSRVIGLIRTVSLQWNYRLTTNWFEIVLCRRLKNCKDPTEISVKRMARGRCNTGFKGFGRLNNKIYCLESWESYHHAEINKDSFIRVFEDQDMDHSVKNLLLPSMKNLSGMVTCKQSNSLYVWETYCTEWPPGPAVWHLVLDGAGGLEAIQWPSFTPLCDGLDCSLIKEIGFENLCVLDDGNLLAMRSVFYKDHECDTILSVHKPDGFIMRNITLSLEGELSNIAMKLNGNFVFAQLPSSGEWVFRELDENGREIHEFHWMHRMCCIHSARKQLFLDAYDRVIFLDGGSTIVFLDCELNFLREVEILETKPASAFGDYTLLHAAFDKETNEMIVMYWSQDVLFLKLTM